MKGLIETSPDQSSAFYERWQVSEALFGSVLTGAFMPESDVDILVRFHPDARPTLLAVAPMREELSQMLRRQVDLVERSAVEASRNHLRRQAFLRTAETLYAA